MVTVEAVRAARDELVRTTGPWTAHRVHLIDDLYTIDEPNNFGGWSDLLLDWVSYFVDRPLAKLRMLDLGCLEGGFAIEWARRGMNTVGIEVRQQNIVKANFAAAVSGLENARFVQDDVRNLSPERYGHFDITLCAGILYHLDAPDCFELAARIAEVTNRVAVFDTHYSTAPNRSVDWRGKTYEGHDYVEHHVHESEQERLQKLWASIGNPTSFWPTIPSLVTLLREVGFSQVFQADPGTDSEWKRVRLIALKAARNEKIFAGD